MDLSEQRWELREYVRLLNILMGLEYESALHLATGETELSITLPWFDSDAERRAAVEEAGRIVTSDP